MNEELVKRLELLLNSDTIEKLYPHAEEIITTWYKMEILKDTIHIITATVSAVIVIGALTGIMILAVKLARKIDEMING